MGRKHTDFDDDDESADGILEKAQTTVIEDLKNRLENLQAEVTALKSKLNEKEDIIDKSHKEIKMREIQVTNLDTDLMKLLDKNDILKDTLRYVVGLL